MNWDLIDDGLDQQDWDSNIEIISDIVATEDVDRFVDNSVSCLKEEVDDILELLPAFSASWSSSCTKFDHGWIKSLRWIDSPDRRIEIVYRSGCEWFVIIQDENSVLAVRVLGGHPEIVTNEFIYVSSHGDTYHELELDDFDSPATVIAKMKKIAKEFFQIQCGDFDEESDEENENNNDDDDGGEDGPGTNENSSDNEDSDGSHSNDFQAEKRRRM